MIGYQILLRGNWGHFRRAETNNNPLTHDFVTKTAFIGLMGAVLGIEREEMRSLFPVLSEQIRYGVQVNTAVKKESWSFTMRSVDKQNAPDGKAPRQMEFLCSPEYTVVFCSLDNSSPQTVEMLNKFAFAVRQGEAMFTPVLGLHNCPAELGWIGKDNLTEVSGEYQTKGFVLCSHQPRPSGFDAPFHLGFDRIPTYQTQDWVSPREHFQEIVYPSNQNVITATGQHYRFTKGDHWCLI